MLGQMYKKEQNKEQQFNNFFYNRIKRVKFAYPIRDNDFNGFEIHQRFSFACRELIFGSFKHYEIHR